LPRQTPNHAAGADADEFPARADTAELHDRFFLQHSNGSLIPRPEIHVSARKNDGQLGHGVLLAAQAEAVARTGRFGLDLRAFGKPTVRYRQRS
jgi:hypothetical protein